MEKDVKARSNKQRVKIYFPETSPPVRLISVVMAAAFVVYLSVVGYLEIGREPMILIAGSGLIAYICWHFTYLKRPVDHTRILPLFLITVTALQFQVIEEYMMHFGPAVSRLFDIALTEERFLRIFALGAPLLYTLTALGLFYRFPIAGFVAWFIFTFSISTAIAHFIFPELPPAIMPDIPGKIGFTVAGDTFIREMPNHYHKVTGHFYFPGMWTAPLPLIAGTFAIVKLILYRRKSQKQMLI